MGNQHYSQLGVDPYDQPTHKSTNYLINRSEADNSGTHFNIKYFYNQVRDNIKNLNEVNRLLPSGVLFVLYKEKYQSK